MQSGYSLFFFRKIVSKQILYKHFKQCEIISVKAYSSHVYVEDLVIVFERTFN